MTANKLPRVFLRGDTIILLVVAAIVAYLALVPLVTLLAASVQSSFLSHDSHWSLANFRRLFATPIFYRLLGNSLLFASCATVVAIVPGVGLGWLHARSDMPCKRFAFIAVIMPFIIPGVLYAIAWILLLSPNIGIYNAAFKAITGSTPFSPCSR